MTCLETPIVAHTHQPSRTVVNGITDVIINPLKLSMFLPLTPFVAPHVSCQWMQSVKVLVASSQWATWRCALVQGRSHHDQ